MMSDFFLTLQFSGIRKASVETLLARHVDRYSRKIFSATTGSILIGHFKSVGCPAWTNGQWSPAFGPLEVASLKMEAEG